MSIQLAYKAALARKKIASLIPTGLIILFNDTTIPDSWERFTAADNKYIVGAGSTYSVGGVGGSLSVNGGATNSAGSHTGSLDSRATTNSCDLTNQYNAAAGSHVHTISGTYTPAYQEVVLIRALESTNIPINGVMLSANGGLGLTNVFTDGYLLKSNNSITDSTSIQSMITSTDGNHTHYNPSDTLPDVRSGGSGYRNVALTSAVGHSHTVTGTLTPSIKKKILSAWSDASSEFNIETDMIAMWESPTPPDGWAICNGSDGTVDLRDYFIGMDSDGNEDAVGSGDNTISGSLTAASSAWSHTHVAVYDHPDTRDAYHSTYSATHSHSATITSDAYVPPYYALYFVQKL